MIITHNIHATSERSAPTGTSQFPHDLFGVYSIKSILGTALHKL